MNKLLLCLLLTSCSTYIKTPKFHVYADHGFMQSYVYPELYNQDGTPMQGSGKLTICNGYGGFVSSLLQDAAIVGSAYLIGKGIGDSGDRTTVANDSQSNSSSRADNQNRNFNHNSATNNNKSLYNQNNFISTPKYSHSYHKKYN